MLEREFGGPFPLQLLLVYFEPPSALVWVHVEPLTWPSYPNLCPLEFTFNTDTEDPSETKVCGVAALLKPCSGLLAAPGKRQRLPWGIRPWSLPAPSLTAGPGPLEQPPRPPPSLDVPGSTLKALVLAPPLLAPSCTSGHGPYTRPGILAPFSCST